jgi:hypothetical protein
LEKTQAGSQHILPSDFMSATFSISWASSPSHQKKTSFVPAVPAMQNLLQPQTGKTKKKHQEIKSNTWKNKIKEYQRPSDFH